MTTTEQQETIDAVRAVLDPLDRWAHQCHAASIAVVKAEVFPAARVGRGSSPATMSQHSWIIVSTNAYDERASIIDPTLWSYDDSIDGIWVGSYGDGLHRPHGGFDSIWAWGRPEHGGGETITLNPDVVLSDQAEVFVELLGPLDRTGWGTLTKAPPHGWPAGEILTAMHRTPAVSALIPIDLLGMVTDVNPGGLYLPGDEVLFDGKERC
jgi:hypothetical protein